MDFNCIPYDCLYRKIILIITTTDIKLKWYLFWVGLENQRIAFFSLHNKSKDYFNISSIIGELELSWNS